MDTTYTYIKVLIDVLQKKKSVLLQIYDGTLQQKELLQNSDFKADEFQKVISLKEMLLYELEKLDNGFEQIYERVAIVLKCNKEMYKDDILTAQKLIQEIMDLNVNICAMEKQNKEHFSVCAMQQRKRMGGIRTNSRVVNNYYKNMPNIHQMGQSYFVDKKN